MGSLAGLRDVSPDHYGYFATPSLLAEAIVELAGLVDALTERVDLIYKLSRRELILDDEGHVI